MKDLIAKLQMDANCAMGAIWLHIDAREARIAELESENAKLRAGAQVVAEPVAQTYEHQRAVMEGERNAAADAYFGAREHLEASAHRRIFDAGFDRGFTARQAAPLPASADKLREALKELADASEIFMAGGVVGLRQAIDKAQTLLATYKSLQAPVLSDEQLDEIWEKLDGAEIIKSDAIINWDRALRRAYARKIIAAANPATMLALLDMIDRPAASGDVRERFEAWATWHGKLPLDKPDSLTGMTTDGQWALPTYGDGYTEIAHRAWFAATQAASAERAPVVGLSDEQILEIAQDDFGEQDDRNVRNGQLISFARLILAAAGEKK